MPNKLTVKEMIADFNEREIVAMYRKNGAPEDKVQYAIAASILDLQSTAIDTYLN